MPLECFLFFEVRRVVFLKLLVISSLTLHFPKALRLINISPVEFTPNKFDESKSTNGGFPGEF